MPNPSDESLPAKKSILKSKETAHEVVIGDLFSKMQDPATKSNWPIIVDPAHEKTMNGNGGMSGAIKAFYEKSGKKKEYIRDLLKFPKVNGVRCPNGDVRRTSTDGVEILHTSAPDLREKRNMKNGQPTEEAKQKLFNAYYNTFVAGAALNRNDGTTRELSCPVLGAGIFKWPMELSAEIAGKALQKFRAEHGSDLQVNFYVHPSALKPGQTAEELKDSLNHNISTGKPSPTGNTQMQAQLADKEVVLQLISYLSSVKKDNYEVYKPLAKQLQALVDSNKSGPKLGAAASAVVQATLDKLNADPNLYPKNLAGAIRGNVTTAYEAVLYKDKVKESKVSFNDTVSVKYFDASKPVVELEKEVHEEKLATQDGHGKADYELVKKGVVKNKQEELPSAEDLQKSPMKKVYVCLQAPDGKDPNKSILRKLTNDMSGLTGFEAVSKQQPNHFATTTDREAIVEWAEQLKEDLKGKPVIIVSIEIPEILLQDGDTLDNRMLGELKNLNNDLIKITAVTPSTDFKAPPEQAAPPFNALKGKLERQSSKTALNMETPPPSLAEQNPVPEIDSKIKIENQGHKTDIRILVDLCENLMYEVMQPLEEKDVDKMMGRVGFLRDLNESIRLFGQGHRTLGDVQKVVADSALVSDKNANPLQVLADGVESIIKETGMQQSKTNELVQIHEIVKAISSEVLNVPVSDKPIELSASSSPSALMSNPQHTGLQNINVQALYNVERENVHKEKTVFHTFAHSVVKGFGDVKANNSRANQIENLQALINQYNNAPNDSKDHAAMQIYCALNYVKAEIGREKNKFSSSLAIVCEDILNKMPQAERDSIKQHFETVSPGNIQGAINTTGKMAMENATPKAQVDVSKKQKLQ